MTTLMRIIGGEVIAKDFISEEQGYKNDMINLDRIMLEDTGDTVTTFMDAIFGLTSEMVKPSHVYLTENGELFSPNFVVDTVNMVQINATTVTANKFTKQEIVD